MIRFDVDVITADLAARTIEGVVTPYGETATIAGQRYRFAPGSLRQRPRAPMLLDHDRSQPVGVLAELVDGPQGPLGRFAIDATPAGDTALVQAASGSRGGLSVGAEVIQARDAGGTVEVLEAEILEVSLVAIGAFAGAQVTRVAAEADPPEPETPAEPSVTEDDDDDETEPAPEPEPPAPANPDQTELDVEPDNPEEGQPMEATGTPVIITAGAERPARELLAGELVGYIIRAQHGEPEARRFLEAALAETISTDVSGLLPPTYERTVIGAKEIARPLYEAFRSRPLPGVGLNVNKPKWTTPPDGQWAATVDDDAHSTKVVVGAQTATVQRWDWAGAISWVVVQRSDPSVIDEIYAEAVQDFYLDVEAKIYGELVDAAPGVSTTMGAAIAEFYTATGNQRAPELIIMAPDVWGAFADAGALTVALVQGAVSAAGDLSTSFAGIRAAVSGTLAAGETVLATRRAVDARVTEPVRLTANAIGALNVELAVVGEGLFDTDYPAELLKFAGITPTIASGGGTARSRG